MTTPDIPLHMEFATEVPGTPEQIWEAVATSDGISAWFLRTDLEEREGGSIVIHIGPEVASPGTVTGWDPPNRLAYVEPDWADLTGHPGAQVSPLATEFLVEAQSGGTCVVRVVSSAFGVGADWEQEFFAEMERMWAPFFDHLRLYISHFPGQRATELSVTADVPGRPKEALAATCRALGVTEAGQQVDTNGITAQVERLGDIEVLLRLTRPVPGYMAFFTYEKGDGAGVQIAGYLFSEDAPAFVQRAAPSWKAWLHNLVVPAT